jgi:hypothetical protein
VKHRQTSAPMRYPTRWCRPIGVVFECCALVVACGGTPAIPGNAEPRPALRINELVAKNEGTLVDEGYQCDDWLELTNVGDESIELSKFVLDNGGTVAKLPEVTLAPGGHELFWADEDLTEGDHHLPFKLGATGAEVRLLTEPGQLVDSAAYPALAADEAWARFPDGAGDFSRCVFATPRKSNGSSCTAPAPSDLATEYSFRTYSWQLPYPKAAGPLIITEAALRPAEFIELENISDQPVALSDVSLQLAPIDPRKSWPAMSDSTEVTLPAGTTLAPGDFVAVPVNVDDTTEIEANPNFEGVVTLFARASGNVVDRVDFMSWPENAALARFPDAKGPFAFCATPTPAQANDTCDPIPSREVHERLRYLRTPLDFAALAQGGTALDMDSVMFVIDQQSGGALHLLSSSAWDIHYTFVREVIYGQVHLDRCDAAQRAVYDSALSQFANDQYTNSPLRRFLLGTLVHHGGANLNTVEFAVGDAISAADMKKAFFTAMAHVPDPSMWSIRPVNEAQAQRLQTISGQVPIVDINAPFRNVTFQSLTQGIAYGTLKFIPAAELATAAIDPRTIVVTDQVPNGAPVVAGLITEAFQTPLAHVNVLTEARGVPNMALRNARTDSAVAPHLDQLVRFEVRAGDFSIALSTIEEAQSYWDSQANSTTLVTPRLDPTVRGIQPLLYSNAGALPAIGAKAAQLAELQRVSEFSTACSRFTAVPWPDQAFAIPVSHYLDHFEKSGAKAWWSDLERDSRFAQDAAYRNQRLADLRSMITGYLVDAALVNQIADAIRSRWGTASVHFRSSSNAEDLPEFNGAGLYTSVKVKLDAPDATIQDGLRAVWASLWNTRAFEARRGSHVDQNAIAMGVLVNPAYTDEHANGVAVSRNLFDPTQSNAYFINAQVGEASVTNPAPGVSSDQIEYQLPPLSPSVVYLGHSSISGGQPAISNSETDDVACVLGAIHEHFRALLDSDGSIPWFAVGIEFKFLGDNRTLVVKQARTHPFALASQFADCRGD